MTMSKLPAEFVKAPSKEPKPRVKRVRQTIVASAADPREVMLHLTDEEFAALEDARQSLSRENITVTIEQMLHRVVADWMLRAKMALQRETEPKSPEPAPRDPSLLERLRELVASPLRTWRELGNRLRRLSPL
jgi:hypothetical protein